MARFVFFGALILIIGLFITIPLFSFTLPSPDKIVRREGFSTKILDRNGEVLYDIFTDERRTQVDLEQIPDYLKQGTIAIEDKNFYRHKGYDPLAYLRAVFNIITKRRLQGGSTLTQQLVKNVLLTTDRTIMRKLREFVLAVQIESRYSKDQILELYLNEVPYGGTAWGAEAASEIYFDKTVGELSLVEAAFLAGLPQRPSVYSPYSAYPDAYIERTHNVLRRMREDNYISKEQEQEAIKDLENLEFQSRGASFKAPHFVQYVQNKLIESYGEKSVEQGGLRVYTTIDLKLQEAAQEIVSQEIEKVESLKITNGAALVIDPETSEILAMVGSKDFGDEDYDGQVNVVLSKRQPGSAIKPITYVTALKKGYTASTLLMDVPTVFPGGVGQPDYEPENYDGEFRGPVQIRFALANSINVPAVKTLALVGIRDTLQTAFDLGINSLEPTDETMKRVGLSLTLGGGEVQLIELTGAFGAFVNGGLKVEPVSILKVEDKDGKTLEETKIKEGKRVLSPEYAFIIADILSDNNARSEIFGTNSLLNIPGHDIAVKTGTTNDLRDNWTIGGNASVVVGVWVGNNDNTPMSKVASGVSGASPIWRKILLEGLDGKPSPDFTPPEGIITAEVDKVSGFAAHNGFPSRTEYFSKGTEPGEDTVHVKLKVCKGQGKLASPSDVVSGNFEEKEYFVFKEEDPTASAGGPNRWQEGVLNWINEQADERYRPPTEYCEGGSNVPINVEFRDPRDRTSNLPNKFNVKFTIDMVHPLTLAELEIDGEKVRSFTGPPFEYEAELEDGVHEFRAVAYDDRDNSSDRAITVGVNVPWDYKVE
ncbi:MAG: Penicillin-binding protein [Candidatus Woesebacteria bacterium GW2011_GWB1_43_14]|uniref:Penicillin-binding protein n=1 Tax=Candidatus Woesebacteria bacterium GW2011_GWB1_43_14 TaxID=1618578 RepID=A0A0G1DGQ2_9BACT|nr:MAG: Penicillin-binding protein [Candidatus Woesebacteria bacterium GW2011_GWB1_43_14]